MIDRVLILSLGGCAVLGTLLFLELTSAQDNQPAVASAPARVAEPPAARPQRPQIDALVATSLARPLFSPTRKPSDRATDGRPADEGLPNVRLTGIVIEPDHHLAIFAVPNAKPLVRSEGETVDDWKLESIGPRQVSLSGPTGVTTLEPKTDPNIIRPAVPQPGPTPGQPAATPVQPAAAAGQPVTPGRPPLPVALGRPPLPPGAQPPGRPFRPPPASPGAAGGPVPPTR